MIKNTQNFQHKIKSNRKILHDNEVHVWLVDIEKSLQEIEFYRKLLLSFELEKSNSFRFEKDRKRYILTQSILRLLISSYLNIKPAKIIYSYNVNRKPEIANIYDKKLCFNLSHSGNFIIYAFAWTSQLGIDIELKRQLEDTDIIIDRFCSEIEKKQYFFIQPEDRLDMFFDLWTRKEAYIKARGEGVSSALEKFSVSIDPSKRPFLIEEKDQPFAKEDWYFHNIAFNTKYSACLVVECNIKKIYFEVWDEHHWERLD